MPTADRPWTDADRDLVRECIRHWTRAEPHHVDAATTAVLETLTRVRGWRPAPRTVFDEIDHMIAALKARSERGLLMAGQITCEGCAAIVQRWRRRARRERLDLRNVPPFLLDAACRDCGGEPLRQLAEGGTE